MVEIREVCKSFDTLDVLKDISITINDKEIYGIIGQSGAGKSTLLRCINGLERFQSGSIKVNGQEIAGIGKTDLRVLQSKMGMIFQNFNLLNRLTVYDNVALPLQFWKQDKNSPENKEKIMNLLRLVGLEDKAKSKPRELSGGQKQRVAIARALILNPKILLCDEATSALDPGITRDILALLQKINQELGITIIIVTHQMEVVKQVCQRVALLKGGKMVAEGRPEELFVHPNKDVKEFLQEESDLLPEKGINIQLFFTDKTSDPVITKLARELDIDFSICWAKLEDFRHDIYGSLVINIEAKDKEQVLKFLDANDVVWEVL